MSTTTESTQNLNVKGGGFLIQPEAPQDLFTPEDWNEEQLMIAQTCTDFIDTEILPRLDEIDKQPDGLVPGLLDKAGQLGMLAVTLPEAFGGFGADFNTGLLVTERVGAGQSFSVTLSAHVGIGTLPILYFGTEAQKQKYLPKLGTGELKASYCLTEPGSGSDALAAKTKAILDGDHYVLNGQKMWITNAGFADVFIVFAQIDGDKFTGFIVERTMPGLTFGNEEHKMGIKGSSTRQVFLSDVRVPKENVLGEIGKGHEIAFNILNIGRIKLAAGTLGAAKSVIKQAIAYTNERKQFNKSISEFGAIKHKLAEMAIRTYATESAVYRAGHHIAQMEEALQAAGKPYEEAVVDAAREFAIEAAMLKVGASEMLDFVVDEGVQCYGGYGFSADFPMDRAYRDSRINRIFEGTNEINRMLTLDMYLKRAMKGQIDLMGPAMAIQKELTGIPDMSGAPEGFLASDLHAIQQAKKAVLMIAGLAAQKLMMKLGDEQEVLQNLADMLIWIYQAESAILRTQKNAARNGEDSVALQADAARVYAFDVMDKINKAGKDAILAFTEGDEQKMLLLGLKRYTKIEPFNTKDARRKIAEAMSKKGSLVL